ncbi:MAG: FAD:protein FMN transferase, partial [Bacillota bacterium]
EEIERALSLVDYRDLQVNTQSGSASLSRTGQMVDLGGIAKGYAADRAREIYVRRGIRSAIVDLGGDVVVVGLGPGGSPWRVGIQHPEERQGTLVGVLRASNEAVVTSGDYERFVDTGGARYHHIIDPATGYPAQGGLTSVTVVCGDSTLADALATAVFVLGPERGSRLLHTLPGTGAVLVEAPPARRLHITPGLQGRFTLLDDRYTVHRITISPAQES